jgi:hypothetical protein
MSKPERPLMKVDGACHCGRICYEAEVDPRRTIICHCTSCQIMSGAPYRVNVPVLAENLRLTGEPKIYVKIGGSGQPGNIAFCPDCGTPLYSCRGETPAGYYLRTGAIRQRAELIPRAQGFCDTAMAWSSDISGVYVIPPSG